VNRARVEGFYELECTKLEEALAAMTESWRFQKEEVRKEHVLMGSYKNSNVELTRKVGELNDRLNELTAGAGEEKEPEARCPKCGEACIKPSLSTLPFNCVPCHLLLKGHQVWRRGKDVEEEGPFWVWRYAQDDARLEVMDRYALRGTPVEWVLGPIPSPARPVE
jgi:hypothetical protein